LKTTLFIQHYHAKFIIHTHLSSR